MKRAALFVVLFLVPGLARADVRLVRTPNNGQVPDAALDSRGTLHLVANPIRFWGARTPVLRPPPLLGEHTDEVLSEQE